MKQAISITISAFALVAAIIAANLIYPMTFIITEVDEAEDVVYMENYFGHVYTFEGVEDWWPGDMVSCIMWTEGTPEITDDVIMSVRGVGEINGFAETARYYGLLKD